MAVVSSERLNIEVRVSDFATAEMKRISEKIAAQVKAIPGPLSSRSGPASAAAVDNSKQSAAARDAVSRLRELVDAQRAAAQGFARIGSEAARSLGPAGVAVRDVAGEVLALGDGLEGAISKLGLSRGALLGLGAGAGVLVALTAGLGAAVDKSLELEASLKRARIAGSGLGISDEAQTAEVRRISNATGIPEQEVGAAFGEAFESGARTLEEASAMVVRATRALQDAGLGTSLTSAFTSLKSASDAFGVSSENSLRFLNLIKVAAFEAQSGPEKLLEATSRSAVATRDLGLAAEDVFEAVARASGKGGVAIEQAGRGIDEIIRTISDPSDAGFKILESFGVGLSREEVRAKGFLAILDEIREKVGTAPQDLSRIFSSKNVGAIAATLQPSAPGLSARIDAAAQSTGGLDATALERLERASDRVEKSLTRLGNKMSEVGDAAQPAWASMLEGAEESVRLFELLNGSWKRLNDTAYEAGASVRAFGASIGRAIDTGIRDLFDPASAEAARAQAAALADAARAQVGIESQVTAQLAEQEAILKSLAATREYVENRRANPFTRSVAENGIPTELRGDGLDKAEADARQRIADIRSDLAEFAAFRESSERDAVASTAASLIGARSVVATFFRREPVEVPLKAEQRSLLETIDEALAGIEGREIPVKLKAPVDFLKGLTENPRELNFDVSPAIDKAVASIDAYRDAASQAADILASLQARGLTGAERQRAEAERLIAQTEKLIETLKRQGVEESVIAQIRAEIPGVREDTETKIARDDTRSKVEADARLLGLKIQLIDRERTLAAAVGFTADSDAQAARALAERAKLQRDLVAAQIAGQRAALDPSDTAGLAALKEQEAALLRIVDAETAAAAAAFDRAKIDRASRTSDLVTDAGDDLLVGLDREFAAIERNRAAKIKAAEDGVRSGQLDADALARLLPLYDAIAQRDAERAQRAASQRDAEDIANLVRDASGAYADQVAAIALLRQVERDRYEEALRAEGLLGDALRERLELFDAITERQKVDASIAFSNTSAVQLAEQKLLEDAYLRLESAGVDAFDRIAEAMARARTGQEALFAGISAGLEDLRREFADDFGFGAKAITETGRGFRDGLSGAIQGKSRDGESVGETFLRGQLENVQKQAADFAANKISSIIFGGPEGNQTPSTPDERLLAASDTFSKAVDRFALAADPAANFALTPQPDGITIPGLTSPSPTPQGYDVEGNAVGGFVGPQLPGSGPGTDFALAADDFSKTVGAGAQSAAASFVQGGDAFGAGISSVVGGLANQLGGFLTSLLGGGGGLGGILGFEHGGIVEGNLKPYTPHRAQFGRVVRQKTLIEVAERPGLEEAIIPLRGGAVPVTLSRRETPGSRGGRDEGREATTELVRAMRGADRQRERSASRERSRQAEAPNITVQGSTVSLSMTFQGGQSGDRGDDILRAMPEIERRLTAAIEQGTNRRLVNAVRGAVS